MWVKEQSDSRLPEFDMTNKGLIIGRISLCDEEMR